LIKALNEVFADHKYIVEGYGWVVHFDLEKFFGRVM